MKSVLSCDTATDPKEASSRGYWLTALLKANHRSHLSGVYLWLLQCQDNRPNGILESNLSRATGVNWNCLGKLMHTVPMGIVAVT